MTARGRADAGCSDKLSAAGDADQQSGSEKEVGNRGLAINYSKLQTRGGNEQEKQRLFSSKKHLSRLVKSEGNWWERTLQGIVLCINTSVHCVVTLIYSCKKKKRSLSNTKCVHESLRRERPYLKLVCCSGVGLELYEEPLQGLANAVLTELASRHSQHYAAFRLYCGYVCPLLLF